MEEGNNNLDLWEKLRSVPASAQKKITGGRLKGMTDIKPQWRYEKITEHFGPCGLGWKYKPVKIWTEPGSDGQVVQYVEIEFYYKHKGEWSEPIPGIGGSMLIEKESRGLHTSDEALKMATTDALSVATKMIGLAADVYMGHPTGQYPTDVKQKTLSEEKKEKLKLITKELQLTIKKSALGSATDVYNFMESVKWDESAAYAKLDPEKKECAPSEMSKKKEKLGLIELKELKEMLQASPMTTTEEMYNFMEGVKWNETDAMIKLEKIASDDMTGFDKSIESTEKKESSDGE